jgi:putative transposase
MVNRSPNVTGIRSKTSQENPNPPQSRDDCRVDLGGVTQGQCCRSLPSREHCTDSFLSLEAKVQGGRHSRTPSVEEREEGKGSRQGTTGERECSSVSGSMRVLNRTTPTKKKRELGLVGDLRGRHLSADVRKILLAAIDEAVQAGEGFERVCRLLELNPRAVYRWRAGVTAKAQHGGGGGRNKITPLEEKRVVTLAKKFPQFRCRRIAYQLERKSTVFIGKTKVAEILKKHGLHHAFERGVKKPLDIPGEILLHEPWKKNLLWGTDWTYLRIEERFWFLLLILDWYSRKIVAWGLFPQITKFEVVAVITNAVATEGIDLLPEGAMKPRIVADHGSANIAEYTRKNIEVQGLDLWLSGIGRPTGNARTERVMGTLKREEINLQEQYTSEDEARSRIGSAIRDYNFRRPNAGNGGFAPNSVHIIGRKALTERRKKARQQTQNLRRNHWDQVQSC